MGSLLSRRKVLKPEDVTNPDTDGVVSRGKVDGIHAEFTTDLLKWEELQKLLNEEALKQMKDDFINRPDYFIANMLCLSLQFYRNFDKERDEISQMVRDKELVYRDQLEPYRRRIQFMGAHEVISGRHVLYHPPNHTYSELSGYRQVYVIQDNVQLYPEDEFDSLLSTQYAEVDGPSYRLCVEPSQRHTGYVRLRCVDIIPGVSRNNTYENIYRSMPAVEDDDPDVILDRRPIRRPSLVADEEKDEVDGAASTALMERRPSGVMPRSYANDLRKTMEDVKSKIEKGKGINGTSKGAMESYQRNKLTEFKSRSRNKQVSNDIMDLMKKKLEEIVESDEEEAEEVKEDLTTMDINENIHTNVSAELDNKSDDLKPDLHSTIKTECFINRKLRVKSESDVYGLNKCNGDERRTYLSSERYRQVFEDDFEQLLKAIKKPELINDGQVETPSFVTKEIYKDSKCIYTEYIAAFNCNEWPRCAYEWRIRQRKEKADPIRKMRYSWPKRSVIEEIAEHQGCTIVPMGYYNPRCPNNIMLIEWQLQFVRAEQILLRSLGHQQIRVLLMVQLLFRDHVDKEDKRVLLPYHLRYVLFWLCEHNYRDWQDDRLAVKIKAYLKTLYNALSVRELPHYFIRNVNLLDTIKQSNLRKVQEAVKRISENLPMYLMHTMTRLVTQQDYYPKLSIKKLYKLVKVKKFGLEQLNPNLASAAADEDEKQLSDLESDDNKDDNDMKALKTRLHDERMRRKKEHEMRTGQRCSLSHEAQKKNVDLGVKIGRLNDYRAENLLTLFAKHFLNMAKYSNKFECHPQANQYINFANNMLDILTDEQIIYALPNGSDVEDLKDKIKREKNVTRQGLNRMLSNTHRITDAMEIRVTHTAPRQNWTPQTPSLPTTAQGFNPTSTKPVRSESKLTKPEASTSSKQTKLEKTKHPVKVFPKKANVDKNLSKSLSKLNTYSDHRSEVADDESNIMVLKFESDSGDDESTDL